MCDLQFFVLAFIATVITDGSVMPSWMTVNCTLLLFLLHCCRSNHMERYELMTRLMLSFLLEMHAVSSHLEGAAGAALTELGDAVQIVGGDGLILLLDEAERWEVEAGLLAIPVLQHGGELIYGAPFNKRQTSQVPHLHITGIYVHALYQ